MKKHLLLFFLVLTGLLESTAASFQAGNWRWRNDDGSETSATWKAPVNTPFELNGTGAFRLRFETRLYDYRDKPSIFDRTELFQGWL